MSVTKEQILKALSTVEEPDLKKDLVTTNSHLKSTKDQKKPAFPNMFGNSKRRTLLTQLNGK